MAAKFDPAELKDLLECSICLNRFKDPRVLPCLHSYCLECLENHVSANKDKDGSFTCPQCREKCLLPDGGAEKYPKNFFVNTMQDVLPASILQEPTPESSGPIMCKHHDQSDDEHGEATTFCVQCDAYFCQQCTKSHSMFIKDHEVIPVDEQQNGTETKQDLNCNLHKSIPINWYCKSCSIPVCSECLIENHKDHDSDKLENIEAALKLDMLDVSEKAVKRLQRLQELSAELKENETKMERELEEVVKDLSKTADGLCKLIRQHEATLQGKIKDAREEARKQFKKAGEELQRANKNTSSLKSQAESLHEAPSEQALSTVVHALLNKQKYRYQEGIMMLSARWSLKKQASQPGKLTELTCLGSVDLSQSLEQKEMLQSDDYRLAEPLHVTQLEYEGEQSICSVTPIHKSLIGVAHFRINKIWVYSDSGELQQIVEIPDIAGVTGMVAVDEEAGKLALVDGTEAKLHFVTLANDLVVQRHLTEKVPITPYRISLNHQKQLVLSRDNRIIVFNLDGKITSDITLSTSLEAFSNFATQQTKSGLVICDKTNKRIYFTDARGRLLHTSTDCASPWHAFQTSSGHILVADSDDLKIFSGDGKFLGSHRDIKYPQFVSVSEARRIMYIGCGLVEKMKVRAYKLAPFDLPFIPVSCTVTNMEVTVKIVEY